MFLVAGSGFAMINYGPGSHGFHSGGISRVTVGFSSFTNGGNHIRYEILSVCEVLKLLP